MAIIISHQIRRKEFKRGEISSVDLNVILDGFKEGIYKTIKGENLPKASSLIKVYSTTVAGARRIVYLVDMVTYDAFFLFYRSKNDRIGENISIKNPHFKVMLNKYLTALSEDVENGAVDVYAI